MTTILIALDSAAITTGTICAGLEMLVPRAQRRIPYLLGSVLLALWSVYTLAGRM